MNTSWNPKQQVIDNYLSVCREAAESDLVFKSFKSDSRYTPILEHAWHQLGVNHLHNIEENNPYLLTDYPKVWENDNYGMPKTSDFSFRVCSPTTIQYLSVLSNLIKYIGSLEGFKVVEIGGGYGGQAKIVTDVFNLKEYSIIDLPEVTLLQSRYIRELQIPNTKTFTHVDYPKDQEYDLVISNYAITEVLEPLQSEYVDHILMNSKHGYLTCNAPLSKIDQLKSKFNITELPDIPGERLSNYILVW